MLVNTKDRHTECWNNSVGQAAAARDCSRQGGSEKETETHLNLSLFYFMF